MGAVTGAIIGGGLGLIGAKKQSDAAKDATNAQVDAANQDIAFQRETRDLIRQDQEPYRQAGATALDALMSLTGLAAPRRAVTNTGSAVGRGGPSGVNARDYLGGLGGTRRGIRARQFGGPVGPAVHYNINEAGPENYFSGGAVTRNPNPQTIAPTSSGYVGANTTAVGPDGFPAENPGGVEGGYNFQTDPGYQFRVSEGFRALDRGAAAAGGLLSGGYGRRAIRYGQDYASNEYQNVYNRISNIAGLGQVANQSNMGAALQTAQGVSNALGNQGYARASGYAAQGNAWANAGNQIAQLPWGDIFNTGSSAVSGSSGSTRYGRGF